MVGMIRRVRIVWIERIIPMLWIVQIERIVWILRTFRIERIVQVQTNRPIGKHCSATTMFNQSCLRCRSGNVDIVDIRLAIADNYSPATSDCKNSALFTDTATICQHFVPIHLVSTMYLQCRLDGWDGSIGCISLVNLQWISLVNLFIESLGSLAFSL